MYHANNDMYPLCIHVRYRTVPIQKDMTFIHFFLLLLNTDRLLIRLNLIMFYCAILSVYLLKMLTQHIMFPWCEYIN